VRYSRLVKGILKSENRNGTIDVVMVNDAKMRELNKKFSKKDRTTDVLSFAYGENGILGDVVVSQAMARRNAQRFGVNYAAEVKRLVIHGVLHILGYEHGRKMSGAEKIYQKL
jgi:probable rRNA maturation factor